MRRHESRGEVQVGTAVEPACCPPQCPDGGGRGHARPGLWRPEGRRRGDVAVSEIETKTEAELAIGDVLTGAESELRAQGCLLFKEVEEDDEEDE